MEPIKSNGVEKVDNEKDSKIGTWISVGVVGGVILLTYLIVFGLYMDRL